MPIQITVSFRGTETVRVFDAEEVVIGRFAENDKPGLDLSEDSCVSRQHARLELKNGVAWLTDLGSRCGTQVNGHEIRGQGARRLDPEDVALLGETSVRVQVIPANEPDASPRLDSESEASFVLDSDTSPSPLAAPPSSTAPPIVPTPPAPQAVPVPAPPAAPPAQAQAPALANPSMPIPSAASDPRILHVIDTNKALVSPGRAGTPAAERRLKFLLDLPRQFSALTGSNQLLQMVMSSVVEVIPAARRGALLLRNPRGDSLLLKAYVSADEPAVSQSLAQHAIAEKRGFIWRSSQEADPTASIREYHILSGMYAPLQWKEQVFGVICVDSPEASDAFIEDDLQFLIAIGFYAGMAFAEQQDLAENKKKDKLINRLLANFSPSVRAVLIEQARVGKLRPGGSKTEASILFCDMSGFTERAARMDAQDVVEMLNHYFQPIIETIFRFDGTVDKFVGDAVLAVFGCPQPDRDQHAKAVKASLAIQQVVQATTQLRAARGDETCQVRVGVDTGEVFQGFVGANDRLEFTVIGDAVNHAHRYCHGAGDGEILISHEVFQRVFSLVRTEKTRIQTKEGVLEAYRLKGLRS